MMKNKILTQALLGLIALTTMSCGPVIKVVGKAVSKQLDQISEPAWKAAAKNWEASVPPASTFGDLASSNSYLQYDSLHAYTQLTDYSLGQRLTQDAELVAKTNQFVEDSGHADEFEFVSSDVEISKPGYVLIQGPLVAGASGSYIYLHKKKKRDRDQR